MGRKRTRSRAQDGAPPPFDVEEAPWPCEDARCLACQLTPEHWSDILRMVFDEGKDVYMAWLDDTTALISPNPDKAWIKDRAAGKNGLEGNAAFMDLLKNVDTAATVWVAVIVTTQVRVVLVVHGAQVSASAIIDDGDEEDAPSSSGAYIAVDR